MGNKQLLGIQGDEMTWQYTDNKDLRHIITEHIHAFLWRVMQHVLPKGLRRVRTCGILHGNAKKRLAVLLSQQGIQPPGSALGKQKKSEVFCSSCQCVMVLREVTLPARKRRIFDKEQAPT
jgi:hypothetical protein